MTRIVPRLTQNSGIVRSRVREFQLEMAVVDSSLGCDCSQTALIAEERLPIDHGRQKRHVGESLVEFVNGFTTLDSFSIQRGLV